MPAVLFRGATSVRAAVVNYLTTSMPETLTQARSTWGVDEYELPAPVAYDAYEPYALDRWPLIGVNVVQAGSFSRLGYEFGMSQSYMARYTVRVFTWVRTPFDELGTPIEPEYSESIRLRDDLAAVVRATLLRSGSLGQPQAIVFDESTLAEEYSEATATKGDRFVSGVVHSFDLRVDETVPIQPLGEADEIVVEERMIDEDD